MNTLTGHNPLLKGKNHLLFADKNIDFGLTEPQRERILELWNQGKSLYYITKIVKRNEHEVFLTLYEYWMEGKIDDIEKAFGKGNSLLVPGREQVK